MKNIALVGLLLLAACKPDNPTTNNVVEPQPQPRPVVDKPEPVSCMNKQTGKSVLGIRDGTTIRYEDGSGIERVLSEAGWVCVVSNEVSEPDGR